MEYQCSVSDWPYSSGGVCPGLRGPHHTYPQAYDLHAPRRKAELGTGPGSESKPEPKLRTGLRPKTIVKPGSESSVTGIGVENETGIEIDIDR
ncbi:hypothetical protein EVAR_20454_1 [Eumeta japonica]|uniref:Uncharacterized protein n=1 Tax=Eumeta variegata TaxID=151549 RepID=A0A4C1TXZ2_EUMVA|nr:hypothetical protein EVAR_20454_1 [Eumeta japonica]